MTSSAIKSFLLALAFLLNWFALRGNAQPAGPSFFRQSFVNASFSLVIRPITKEWISLETSADLIHWRPSVSLLSSSTNGVFAFFDDTPVAQQRFYRMVRSDRSQTEAATRWSLWRNENKGSYVFELLRLSLNKGVFSARIKVNGGQKTVANVVDALTGEPAVNFDSQDFPDIDGIFEVIDRGTADPGRILWVRYDEAKGFPTKCFFTKNPDAPQDLLNYEISNMIATPAE